MTTKPVPVHAIGDEQRIAATLDNAVEDALRRTPPFPVYVASCMHHRGMWRHLRRLWASHNIHITSHWIDVGDDHVKASPLALAGGWIENLRDIERSKVLVCFGEGKDPLRGALVEAGIAMGQHKPVIIVDRDVPDSHSPRWGSWQYHPLVMYRATVDDALTAIRALRGDNVSQS